MRKKDRAKKCAICGKHVLNENISKDGFYFCGNDCEADYYHMTEEKRQKMKKNKQKTTKLQKIWFSKEAEKLFLKRRKMKTLTKEEIIEINKKLGKEFKTDSGILSESNLEYALSHKDPYKLSLEILRGHPFIDGNKRTSFMVYMLLTSGESYEKILKDYRDMLRALSK